MAIRYVTVAEARVVSGVSETEIDNTDMTEIIEDVEFEVERQMNSRFTPFVEIDVLDGNAKNSIFTKRSPVLTVRSLESNDVSIDLETIDFTKSGRIRLGTNSSSQNFVQKKNTVIAQYVYGRVGWDLITDTTTDTAAVVGTSVALSVVSETGFATNDWIEIFGTDGTRESAKITGTGTGEITVDQLVQDHVSGSIIRKIEIEPIMKRLIKVIVGIAAIARVVGESSTAITGYSLGELQVQKGEPFTQWREAANQLIRQRDEIQKRVRPTPGIQV
ncbi:hypothetical protein KAR91_07060 [Candidatus Pacearchaeota archaeon]|nr:hypothetical protein [Candidatus Pacearchaeota archaeon]